VRHTANNKAVTGWALAVDSGYGDSKTTLWIDCTLWGPRGAAIAEYITKGSRLGVHGELGTREHDGKTYVTLNVRDVTLLGEKKQERPTSSKPAAKPADTFEDDGDTIPFNDGGA
jgi:single-strand DNA-binding protein